MRRLLLCTLLLTGCAGPRHPNSTEAIAEQKQLVRAQLRKQNDKDNEALRLATRQLYVQDHPELSADLRKAILKEQIKTGMNWWQVVAAYSLWEHMGHPAAERYRQMGALSLWTLTERRQATAGQIQQEEWTVQGQKETQYLYFENGTLKKWKD